MRVGKLRILSTLRGQIVIIYTLLFAVAFFFIDLSVTKLVGEFLISQRIDAQSQKVNESATQFALAVSENDAAQLYALAARNADDFSGRVLVLDMDGIVMADSHSELNGHILRQPEIQSILSGSLNSTYGFHMVTASQNTSGFLARDKDWAVYYTTAIVYQSRSVGVLLVSVSIQDVVDLTSNALLRFSFVALGILIVLIMSSVIVSRFISLPIVQMTEAITQMSKGEFQARTKIRGNSEIAQLARTFNTMSEQLENIERQRQEFVSNASHELKTPLSAIKILAESLLYEQNVPEATYKEFLSDINEQIDRMNLLLRDLLILAQSERSSTAMRYTMESLDNLIAECAKTLMPLSQEKHIKLSLPENKIQMRCDRLKLNTAIMNLISNGIKYTPEGGSVSVNIEEEKDEGGVQWIKIIVSDTGIGIPEEDRIHIFERFYRVDKARSRDTGGTGLGLAIVQQVARLHGGEVALSPNAQQGSVFVMRLPRWGVGE